MTLAAVEPARMTEAWMFEHTVERLCAEFGDIMLRARVESVLRRSLADLAGSPVGAMPELSERLARQRLSEDMDVLAAATAAAGGQRIRACETLGLSPLEEES